MEEFALNNDMNTISVVTQITYLLFLFLILALFVERSVEVFMSILKYADLKLGMNKLWNLQAEKFKTRMDRLFLSQGSESEDKKLLFKRILWNFVSEKPYVGGKDFIAALSIRTHYYRIISRIFAFILSGIFSIWIYRKFNMDLFAILENVGNFKVSLSERAPLFLKILLTAGILTAGSEPLHQLILKFENIGKPKKA